MAWESFRQEFEEAERSRARIESDLSKVSARLDQIWEAIRSLPKHRATSIKLLFGPIGTKMATAILHLTDHSVTATIVASDASGNVVPLPSPPTWSLSADGIASMVVAADGMSASFAPVAPGAVTINVVAEGDPTPGVDTLHGSGDITVLAAEATSIAINFGPVT